MAPDTYSQPFVVENHGSIIIVQPLTAEAWSWIDEHVSADALWWGGGLVVEPRYAADLIAGMQQDLLGEKDR